jgi:hypothetical protein
MAFECEHCEQEFKSKRGLTHHQRTKCWNNVEAYFGVVKENRLVLSPDCLLESSFGFDAVDLTKKRPALATEAEQCPTKMQRVVAEDAMAWAEHSGVLPRKLLEDTKMAAIPKNIEDDDMDLVLGGDENVFASDNESVVSANQNDNPGCDETTLREFKDYCDYGRKHHAPLEANVVSGIRLLDILKRKKAPLDTYDEIMEWHLRDKGVLLQTEVVGQSDEFVSRETIINTLKKRYHMDNKFPFTKDLVLPHSHAQVKVVCNDARRCVESLLTDPRLRDKDFAFFDNDPLAPPPDDLDYIQDMNTGEAYINGYKEYVTKPNQIGVGIQWYIDGAVTGQFDNLSITALKMSLSIFTKDYRMNDHAWRTLGYVVNYSKAGSRGKKMFVESQHMDAEFLIHRMMDEEGEKTEVKDTTTEKAQDFHAQLEAILETYVEMEAKTMAWDLYYRHRLHKNLELVFWTIMVKCDTDEAELLTGKYRSRSGNVKQLCRYCTCPNQETDNPMATYPFKTVPMIQTLVDNEDMAGLKAMSQQYIDNAWYKVRFNPGNNRGIHGACPSEMLHALLLGIFKYTRECFFAQVGKTSELAKEIDALAKEYGDLLSHQSERDMPKCKFSEGIRKKGKLMAKEYRGVMLVIATVLRSTKGRELLKKNKNFGEDFLIKDWLLLVEMLLEWEAYLSEPRLKKAHVRRMMKKNRFIMHIIRKVAR